MKSKKILTILLSLAIMFTFMPTLAFAANVGTGTWNYPDYTTVSVSSGGTTTTYSNVKKTWTDSTGLVTAALDWTSYSTPGPAQSKDYYDLNSSVIKAYDVYTYDNFTSAFPVDTDGNYNMTGAALIFSKPSYVTGTNTATHEENSFSGWGSVAVTATGFDPTSYEDQTVTLTAKVTPAGANGTQKAANRERFVGTVPTKTITVQKKAAAATQIIVAVDEIKAGVTSNYAFSNGAAAATAPKVDYTGAAHKLVANSVPGFTVSYKQFNPTTNAYEDVDAISGTDAGVYEGTVIVKNATTGASVYNSPVSFEITKTAVASVLNFGFAATTNSAAEYYVEGADYDAYEWVEIWTATGATKEQKAAIAANKADIMAVFKAVTKVTAKADKNDPNKFTVGIEDNDLVAGDAEVKALNKTYKQLLANLGFSSVTDLRRALTGEGLTSNSDHYASATVHTNYVKPDDDYEVTFTKAITSKTYKGKYTTKKGKLKKNQTIQFTAETTLTGATIAYKLVNASTSKIKINKSTGKVTLKKGLGKGTYKFKVKAYVPGFSEKASEVQTVTIKVKK